MHSAHSGGILARIFSVKPSALALVGHGLMSVCSGKWKVGFIVFWFNWKGHVIALFGGGIMKIGASSLCAWIMLCCICGSMGVFMGR